MTKKTPAYRLSDAAQARVAGGANRADIEKATDELFRIFNRKKLNRDQVQDALNNGADIDALQQPGNKSLFAVATRYYSAQKADALISLGYNLAPDTGETPIEQLLRRGNPNGSHRITKAPILEALLKHGGGRFTVEPFQNPLLHEISYRQILFNPHGKEIWRSGEDNARSPQLYKWLSDYSASMERHSLLRGIDANNALKTCRAFVRLSNADIVTLWSTPFFDDAVIEKHMSEEIKDLFQQRCAHLPRHIAQDCLARIPLHATRRAAQTTIESPASEWSALEVSRGRDV